MHEHMHSNATQTWPIIRPTLSAVSNVVVCEQNDPQSWSCDRHVLCVVLRCAAAMRKLLSTITQNGARVVVRRDGVCTGGNVRREGLGWGQRRVGWVVHWCFGLVLNKSPGVSASKRGKYLWFWSEPLNRSELWVKELQLGFCSNTTCTTVTFSLQQNHKKT